MIGQNKFGIPFMPVNINHRITFMVNQNGLEMLKQYCNINRIQLKKSNKGYYTMIIWHFINCFGGEFCNGVDPPVKPSIYIETQYAIQITNKG